MLHGSSCRVAAKATIADSAKSAVAVVVEVGAATTIEPI